MALIRCILACLRSPPQVQRVTGRSVRVARKAVQDDVGHGLGLCAEGAGQVLGATEEEAGEEEEVVADTHWAWVRFLVRFSGWGLVLRSFIGVEVEET